MTCYHSNFKKEKRRTKQNTVIQCPWYVKNEQQPFELSFFPSPRYSNSFDFTSKDNFCTPRHPLPSSQPMSHSCPPKKWEIFFVCDLEHGIKTTALERYPKKNRLCGCRPSESFKSWWPRKNLLNHLFCCKILFFNTSTYINKTSPLKSPRLVSSKCKKCSSSKRNSASPPLQIVGGWAPFGSSCDFTCRLCEWPMGCASKISSGDPQT